MPETALLEIGVEEIPASVVLPALRQMKELAAKALEQNRLTFGEISTYGTPRRLAISIADVADRQPDLEKEVKGPPADRAFDESGEPTKAALGFAKKQGLEVSDLEIRETEKGTFVFAQVTDAGRATTEVLAEIWPEIIRQLAFPKTMRWADLQVRFARPIRWLAALHGSEVVEFEVAEVESGRASRGHRFLGSESFEFASADDYLDALEGQSVIADHHRRREMIRERAQAAATEAGGRPRVDPDLLEEVGFLVEYPTCLCGSFPEKYLALPEPALVTVMAKHQRYFPVEGPDGKLMPLFVAIRNGDERALETVRRGNEMVIVPRFADAEFYFTEDTKRTLADRLPDLERVAFMEQHGSMRDKTGRIVALAEALAEEARLDTEAAGAAVEAAGLCKCDLVTLMVQDLTSLQGIMGAEYGSREGLPETVCAAIGEHYRPAYAGDAPPVTDAGRVVSLADKLDSLAACFALNLIPKGTSDPYGLRRRAAGVLSIIVDAKWRVDLPSRLTQALGLLPAREVDDAEALMALQEFIGLRLDALLEGSGVAYDVRRAVLGAPCPDLLDAHDRALALQRAREVDAEDFDKTTYAASRVGKIQRSAADQSADAVDPALFEGESESALWDAYTEVKRAVDALASEPGARDYEALWEALCRLERPVWDFFDVDTGVMVMAEDRKLRGNRLALLSAIDGLFLRVGDFTEIVVE